MTKLLSKFMTVLRHRASHAGAALFLGAFIAPISLSAQAEAGAQTDSATTVSASAATPISAKDAQRPAGPRVAPAALTRSNVGTDVPALPPADDNVNMGPNLALMGAGAAAIVVGLLIGGDGGTAIALGGGVIGLIGLYRYLR
jgi:hypothetical protein